MFNKNDWLFASPAVPAGCTGVCFADLFGAHNAADIFCTFVYMRAEFCIAIVGETNTEAGMVQLVYVANHRT